MIKLVVCVGFLAVFGVAGYCIVLLMIKAFGLPKENSKEESKNDSINQKPKTEENGK